MERKEAPLACLAALCLCLCLLGSASAIKFNQYQSPAEALNNAKIILGSPLQSWALWQSAFDVSIPPLENSTRYGIWLQAAQRIFAHNALNDTTWTAGFNEYSHLTFKEFRGRLNAVPEPFLKSVNVSELTTDGVAGDLPSNGRKMLSTPTSYDWTSSGKVTSVKNQGSCGSCWAFAAIGAIESLYLIKRGTTYDLSEAQLVDCADAWSGYFNWGCSGGYASEALRYATNKKLFLESYYRYDASTSGSCDTPSATSSNSVGPIAGYSSVTDKSSNALMASVYTSPTTVYFDVVDSFQDYDSGVYSGSDCGTSSNHVMLAVGYVKGAYWKIKNSWGSGWGESGYVRVKFIDSTSSKGTCGMYMDPYRPYL